MSECAWENIIVFNSFFPKKGATFPLVRRDFYKKTIQDGLLCLILVLHPSPQTFEMFSISKGISTKWSTTCRKNSWFYTHFNTYVFLSMLSCKMCLLAHYFVFQTNSSEYSNSTALLLLKKLLVSYPSISNILPHH